MEQLSREEQIRVEALKLAFPIANAWEGPNGIDFTKTAFVVADTIVNYIVGPPNPNASEPVPVVSETSIVYDKLGNTVSSSDDFPVDLTGYTLRMTGKPDHVHLPHQHSDGKPPWCNHCGLTKELVVPRSRFYRGDKPTIHDEPDCEDNPTCNYPEVHKHGFACDKTCALCHGKCHVDCPAHDEYYGINPGMPKP
jgi:hypothetical protein